MIYPTQRRTFDTAEDVREWLDGASAGITGRPIKDSDRLLGKKAFTAIAGQHGAEIRRHPDDEIQYSPVPKPAPEWIAAAKKLAVDLDVVLEVKRNGFGFHFPDAPEKREPVKKWLTELRNQNPYCAENFRILRGHHAEELQPLVIDKAKALHTLRQLPPFRGKKPVFLGDDTTDLPPIEAAKKLGGMGFLVKEGEIFSNARQVRQWLKDSIKTWRASRPKKLHTMSTTF